MTMYRMRQREFVAALATARAGAARGAARSGGAAPRDGLCGAHAHAAGAADDRRALPAGGHRAARARRRPAARRPTSRRTAIRSARARSPAPAFRSIGSCTSELLGFDGPTGNTYGSIATVDYLLESVSATRGAARRPRPRRAGPAALVHAWSSAICGSATASCRRAASCRRSATRWRSSTRARSAARRSGRRRRSSRPSTTRRSATSSTPRTICSRSSRRCSATRRAR